MSIPDAELTIEYIRTSHEINGWLSPIFDSKMLASKVVEILLAEIDREWQPIETAPVDYDSYEKFLLWGPDCGHDVGYAAWEQDGKPYWFNGDVGVIATHWMPLPPPPAEYQYEWKAMSEWINENLPTQQGESVRKTPMDDGWELVGGALRRLKPS